MSPLVAVLWRGLTLSLHQAGLWDSGLTFCSKSKGLVRFYWTPERLNAGGVPTWPMTHWRVDYFIASQKIQCLWMGWFFSSSSSSSPVLHWTAHLKRTHRAPCKYFFWKQKPLSILHWRHLYSIHVKGWQEPSRLKGREKLRLRHLSYALWEIKHDHWYNARIRFVSLGAEMFSVLIWCLSHDASYFRDKTTQKKSWRILMVSLVKGHLYSFILLVHAPFHPSLPPFLTAHGTVLIPFKSFLLFSL